ncbi:MAG: acylneuraminate cytidylyltransferase family protein [Veillonella sp. oral taxon 780]|uniref:acylneuraminate cytidylyltransferase family protein n=1 Tax=Veillonella sp. CNR 79/14 TaxID=2490954 RepID=UPI000F8E9112|nr:acylneuraminate cytidylyltransferase family protein [Veillonella sp. CNR 79/14]MBS6626077.1 acylneuraminate cytidylyltransferase family protein [Veillonella sp. oral taxon 780]
MYQNKKVLAIIPARGGSKGIPHKNIISLCGKPLIAYTIEAANQSTYIDTVIVSTDDVDIQRISEQYGALVPFLREAKIASDEATTISVVVDAVKRLEVNGEKFDVVILLQPTSPLRTAEEIDVAIDIFFQNNMQGIVSVNVAEVSPFLLRTIEGSQLQRIISKNSTIRRQDMPTYYEVNGAIYINAISDIKESLSFNDNPIPYIMSCEHSIDIDTWDDLEKAKYYLSNKRG